MSHYLGYVIEQLIHEDEKMHSARVRRRKQRKADRSVRAQRRTGSSEAASGRRILSWSSLTPKH